MLCLFLLPFRVGEILILQVKQSPGNLYYSATIYYYVTSSRAQVYMQ
jgi:hypothetical protein